MVYSFHHFYYWVKGGVEAGLAYRSRIFKKMGVEAKFVFATPFPEGNMQHEMERLGLEDSDVIWMYSFFTNCKIAPCSVRLSSFLNSLEGLPYEIKREHCFVQVLVPETKTRYAIKMVNDNSNTIVFVDTLVNECLLRRDYYTYVLQYSEFYVPRDHRAKLYMRRFYNEDGTAAYEELWNEKNVRYVFPDMTFYSMEELVGYMMKRMQLNRDDLILIDGEPGNIDRSAFILNASPARVGFMVHADHVLSQDEDTIQWYKFYSYAFMHPEKIDFYITNTDLQSEMLRSQLKKYSGVDKKVYTIPASGLKDLKYSGERNRHSLITAGRLAPEKNTDMVIKAVANAKKKIPDITLDIYGEGMLDAELQKLIDELDAREYIKLCGFQKISELYSQYDAYVSASFIETLGITYLEAVGSGLPIVAFDIPYGAKVLVDEGKNGYLAKYGDIDELSELLVKLFSETDLTSFREHSYEIAKEYLQVEIEKKWKSVIEMKELFF